MNDRKRYIEEHNDGHGGRRRKPKVSAFTLRVAARIARRRRYEKTHGWMISPSWREP